MVIYAHKPPRGRMCTKFGTTVGGRRRNRVWQVFWWSVEGCRFCRGSDIVSSFWLSSSPLTQGWRYRTAPPVIFPPGLKLMRPSVV